MVLDEAIKDKTAQVEKEMEDKQRAAQEGYPIEQVEDDKDSLDDDDFFDDEEEKIMRQIKEQRLAEMAADYEE